MLLMETLHSAVPVVEMVPVHVKQISGSIYHILNSKLGLKEYDLQVTEERLAGWTAAAETCATPRLVRFCS